MQLLVNSIRWLMLLTTLVINTAGSQRRQYGPDPWDQTPSPIPERTDDSRVPPDLSWSQAQVPHPPTGTTNEPNVGDWFFKRLLVIILKNGALKSHEDGSKEISIMMKVPALHWSSLEEYIHSDKPLTEEMYRRSVGYLSEAIYRPSLTERVAQAWSEYILFYYKMYKVEITWIITAVGIIASIAIMSKYMSRKVLLTLVFILLYMFEVFVSFKEYEKKDYDQFVKAVSQCKWSFWSSSCSVPMSDPLVFWKHMHPGKIAIRLCSLLITEPLLAITSAVNTISSEITGGLWYPFDKIVHGCLILFFNVMCILLIIMLVCNVLLNIPFNIGFLFGLLNFGVSSRQTSIFATNPKNINNITNNGDRLTGENLQKLIDIAANAANTPLGVNRSQHAPIEGAIHRRTNHRNKHRNDQRVQPMIRSLSAGRVADRL